MQTTRKLLTLLAIPVLLLTSGGALSAQQAGLTAQEPAPISPPLLTELLAQEWEMVAPAVLQRIEPDGELVTLVIGSEGYSWQLRQMQARLEVLEARAEQVHTAELRQAISDVRDLVARLTLKVEQASDEGWGLQGSSIESLEPILQMAAGCNSSVYASASAGPTTTGPKGTGSSSFFDGCSAFGETLAYAYADGSYNGTYTSCYQNDPSDGYGSASSYANCTVTANTGCYSSAYAWAEIPGVGDITRSDYDYDCRVAPPLSVSISGPTLVTVESGFCEWATWTASVSGGTPSYSYQWRYDGVVVSTGSSYSRKYCSLGYYQHFNDTVSVTVNDSGGQSDSASKTVYITLFDDCLQPYQGVPADGGDGNTLGFKLPIQPCLSPE
jgi:hypothetical protein